MHIEPTTPRTVPLMRARRGAMVWVAALACAALISACGSSSSSSTTTTNLNTNRVARSIEENIFVKRHIHATVTCPATVPQEKGRTFVCLATSHSTKNPSTVTKTPFKVTIETKQGYVTYIGE